MKRLALISCFGALALAQQSGRSNRAAIDFTALQQWREGNVFHLSGNVAIETPGFTLRASEADFDEASQEIQARGNVNISLK